MPEWGSPWCSTSLNLQETQNALFTTRRIALKACEVTWSEPWTINTGRKPHTLHLMPSDTTVHCPLVSKLVQQSSPCTQLRVFVALTSLRWQLLRMQFSTWSSYVPCVTTFHDIVILASLHFQDDLLVFVRPFAHARAKQISSSCNIDCHQNPSNWQSLTHVQCCSTNVLSLPAWERLHAAQTFHHSSQAVSSFNCNRPESILLALTFLHVRAGLGILAWVAHQI